MVNEILQLTDAPLPTRALAVGGWLERARQYGPQFYQECVEHSVRMLSNQVCPYLLVSDHTHSSNAVERSVCVTLCWMLSGSLPCVISARRRTGVAA